jgi:hypothetical protein
MSNTDEILGNFIRAKNCINPMTGKPLSRTKRLTQLFDVIYNKKYEKKHSKNDMLLAVELVKQIINEQ